MSDASINALNVVQATPWRINTWILDIVQEAFAKGIALPALEAEALPAVPAKVSDAAWAALDAEGRKAHIGRRRDTYAKRVAILSRHQSFLERLTVAERCRSYERIYFPHTLDFRGRLYPIPMGGPHPQGDDLGRALLHFAEGLSLGSDGLFWLCVRAANTFGLDKLPLEERVAWTLGHSESIRLSATSPLTGSRWWTEADEPWCFLATCNELTRALSLSSTDNFVSHLPIPLDGSCNGLQHLSSLALDPVGATATNLAPGPRQDIYEEVAKRVATRVELDASAGVIAAMHWHGRVTRKLVKRATMTTPYGVTDGGIRTQLLNDGQKLDNQWFAGCEAPGYAADYMRDCIVAALSDTAGAAKAVMAWIQTVAFRLAEQGLPFDWVTPTGSKCRQAYTEFTVNRIDTVAARVHIGTHTDVLIPRKQALGSAPNLVHSFDAAHLSLTVNAAHAAGINSFAMIHDSFATHARQTTLLARILREEFVAIYKRDWLSEIYTQISDKYPDIDIPEPPPRGTFDIEQVLDAPFFFS